MKSPVDVKTGSSFVSGGNVHVHRQYGIRGMESLHFLVRTSPEAAQ